MDTEHQGLGSSEIFQIIDNVDHSLNVLRRQQGTKTPLDVYFVSVLSTLRRVLLDRVARTERPAASAREQ